MLRKESMKTSDKLRLLLIILVCIFLLLQIGARILSCTEFNKANTHSVSLEYDCFSSTAVSQVNENAFPMPLGPEWQMHFYRSQIFFYISIVSGVITICSAIALFIRSQLRRKAEARMPLKDAVVK